MFWTKSTLTLPHLLDVFLAAWSFFGAGLALVLGIGVLLHVSLNHDRGTLIRQRQLLIVALCAVIAIFLLQQSLAFSGVLLYFPQLLWCDLPFVYLAGPLLYLFCRARTAPDSQGQSSTVSLQNVWHLVPALLAVIVLAPYLAMPGAERLNLLAQAALAHGETGSNGTLTHESFVRVFHAGHITVSPRLWLVAFVSELSLGAYGMAVLWQLRDVFQTNDAADTLRLRRITALLAIEAAFVGALGMGSLSISVALVRAAAFSVVVTVLLLYFVDRAFPAYFDRIFEIGRQARYRRSRLNNVVLDELAARFERLMREHKPYLQDDLSLAGLAQELEISAHQLSEFLNDHLQRSFHNVVNEYRIREAQRLLGESDDTVLSIAFAVGFNNRASFNAAFQKFSGTTPIAYRRSRKHSLSH